MLQSSGITKKFNTKNFTKNTELIEDEPSEDEFNNSWIIKNDS